MIPTQFHILSLLGISAVLVPLASVDSLPAGTSFLNSEDHGIPILDPTQIIKEVEFTQEGWACYADCRNNPAKPSADGDGCDYPCTITSCPVTRKVSGGMMPSLDQTLNTPFISSRQCCRYCKSYVSLLLGSNDRSQIFSQCFHCYPAGHAKCTMLALPAGVIPDSECLGSGCQKK